MKVHHPSAGLTVFESALYRTNTSLIENGKDLMLVDPNWLPSEIDYIRDYIENNYPDRSIFLYFTHADFDHILGYGAFPKATTLADEKFVNLANKIEILSQINIFDDQFYIHRSYPIAFPKIDIVIDRSPFVWNKTEWPVSFLLTTGHVNNGSSAIFENKHLCIAGDYLSNIEIPWVEYDFTAYYTTLQIFQTVFLESTIEYVVPGHGDVAVGQKEIQTRLSDDLQYIHAFLVDFSPENPVFETIIQAKGNINQNRIIHQKNIDFFLKS